MVTGSHIHPSFPHSGQNQNYRTPSPFDSTETSLYTYANSCKLTGVFPHVWQPLLRDSSMLTCSISVFNIFTVRWSNYWSWCEIWGQQKEMGRELSFSASSVKLIARYCVFLILGITIETTDYLINLCVLSHSHCTWHGGRHMFNEISFKKSWPSYLWIPLNYTIYPECYMNGKFEY